MISNALGFIPQNLPSLNLDFTQGILNPALSFSRNSIGTYFDANGIMQTAAVNAPRFDYDPVTKQPLGLLIEEQRTNLLSRSKTLQDFAYTTLTANAAIAPDSTNTAYLNTFNTAAGPRFFIDYATSNGTYTGSIWMKAVAGSTATKTILCIKDCSSDTQRGSLSVNIPAVWTRLSVTGTTAGSSAGVRFEVNIDTQGSSATLLVWGPQLETGSSSSSYIPTTNATATRSAEICTMSVGSWFNVNEGSFLTEAIQSVGANGQGAILDVWKDVNNKLTIRPAQTIYGQGGVNQFQGSYGFNQSVRQKIAAAYKLNDAAIAKSGAIIITDNSVNLVTGFTTLYLGITDTNLYWLNGWIRAITYYPRRISNTTLQALTL